MKRLICEMCEGTDFVKQEGVFVCQSCGTKYSVEEAKRMMIEGTVEVAGTVKVDNTGKLDNLFKLARRAKEESNFEKAAQYYEQFQLENPLDWESAFYAIYFSAILKWRNDEEETTALNLLHNCIDSVLNIISYNIKEKNRQILAINEISRELSGICSVFYGSNESTFQSFYQRYAEYSYSSHNHNLFIQCLQKTTNINYRISVIYYALGEKMLSMYENESDLDDLAKTLMEQANKIARENPCNIVLQAYSEMSGIYQLKSESENCVSEIEEMVNNGMERITQKQEVIAKHRFIEYWDAHKHEKAEFEAEKKSLNEQIVALNQEITRIPERTDGYVKMIELQKEAQEFASEKSRLGLFKIKEKKAVQEKIDAVNCEISVIQLHIDSALDEVKKRITPLENKVKAIDIELTKPR